MSPRKPDAKPAGADPKALGRPLFTIASYVACILAIYLMLFKAVGADMALKYIASGKGYANVLISLRKMPRKPPEDRARIFFLGDSTIAILDEDKAPPMRLEKLLRDAHGENTVEVIDWAFSGASMFHYYCLICQAEKYSSSIVIIPINYRTFGSLWQEMVRDNEKREIVNSELIVFAPLWEPVGEGKTGISELEGFTVSDRVVAKLKFWEIYYFRGIKLWILDRCYRLILDTSPIADEIAAENRRLQEGSGMVRKLAGDAKHTEEFLKTLFPMEISENQSQYRAYEALLDALQRRKMRFLFFVTPIDIESLKEYSAFSPEKFASTVEMFRSKAVSNGGAFLDLSMLLESDCFMNYEHYKADAAGKVASALRPEVEKIVGLKDESRREEERNSSK
jgi:hypothetical protein